MFFKIQTRKTDMPFRSIVSERGSRKLAVSSFLQTMLNYLSVKDPFAVLNSEGDFSFLCSEGNQGLRGFSIDIEDLYSSLPKDKLMKYVEETITQDNDEVAVKNRCGMPV